jgi:hypothetical protein
MTQSRHHVWPKRHRNGQPDKGEIHDIPYNWHKSWHIIFADLSVEEIAERLKLFLPRSVEVRLIRR